MLMVIINYHEKIPNPIVNQIIEDLRVKLGVECMNTVCSLKSYLNDSEFKSGHSSDTKHILIDYKDFPYIIEPIMINTSSNLQHIKSPRGTANIIVGTREFIKRYYEGLINPEPTTCDLVSLNLSKDESFIEFRMYELIKNSDDNLERSIAFSHLNKKSCSINENSSVVSLTSKISGYDATDILNILMSTKESISISILEKIQESEGTLSYEDILVEVPAFGLAYIQDNNVLVSNLGRMTIDEQILKLREDAESAVSKALSRAKVKMLHNETVFPKKVRL